MLKILLIKRGALGDVLMTTPLIRQLRLNFPDCIIDYCIAKPFISAIKDNSYLNNIIALDDNVFTFKGLFKYIKFAFSIRNKYNYIFILGKNWQLNLLSIFMGSTRIGYAREAVSKILLNKSVMYNDVQRYHGLYYLDLLQVSRLAQVDYNDCSLDFTIPNADKDHVDKKLQDLGLNSFVIVTNSGGNNSYEVGGVRMLPDDITVDFLSKLLSSNNVVLLGSNSDDQNYRNYRKRLNDAPNLYSFAGGFNLAQSAYLISKADHFYTTDCGAMHLGVIMQLGSKMTCFFGPTCPNHVLPPDNNFNIIWKDQDILEKDYPLRGKLPKHKYFEKLKINAK